MSTCVVKLAPRTLAVALHDLETRERSTLVSLLAYMWCNEGHVPADEKTLARRSGLRPSAFRKSLAILADGELLMIRADRLYLGRKLEGMLRRAQMTAEQRARVRAEESKCAYCGDTDGPFAVDHIHPASRGGTNHRRNLTLSCVPCNSTKRAHLLSEMEDADE